ncbi:MAG: hypothetical protein ACRELY_17345, partial [Polyangiaceae bacterium]
FPFFRAFGWLGLFVVPIAGGAFAVFLAGKIAEDLRPGTGWIAAALTAFTTPVLFYATLFWEHTPAMALLMLSTFFGVRFMRGQRMRDAFYAGAPVGLAAAGLRTDANLFFASLFGALFLATPGKKRWLTPIVATAGFAVGASPASAINWVTNGKILAANTAKNTPRPSLAYLKDIKLGIVSHFLVGHDVPLAIPVMLLGGVAVMVVVAVVLRKSAVSTAVSLVGLALLMCGGLLAVHDVSVHDAAEVHGWLATAPLLGLAAIAVKAPVADSEKTALRFALYLTALMCLANMTALALAFPNAWAAPNGNREWGPRYWLTVYPLLSVLVAVGYDVLTTGRPRFERAQIGVAYGAVALCGVLFIGAGFTREWRDDADIVTMKQFLARQDDTPLMTDCFFVSALVPDKFFERPSFYISIYDLERYRAWLRDAARGGLDRLDLGTYLVPELHPFLMTTVDDLHFEVLGVDRTPGTTLMMVHLRLHRGTPPR